MGMKRNATTTRKPPEPSGDHGEIEEWIGTLMPALQPIVRHVDDLLRDAIPGLQYALKWKKAYYGLPKRGWIVEMVAYDVSVNVVFLGGAEFDDPPPLGESGRSRYVKLTSLEEAQRSDMRTWIKQATSVDGWT